VHFEDQLASEKKCGHLGGKVLVPTSQFIRTLLSARLAADVCGVPSIVVARTDAHSASLITSDVDERDHPFLTGERTGEGFFMIRNGVEAAIARADTTKAEREAARDRSALLEAKGDDANRDAEKIVEIRKTVSDR
jgi:isocitrate lyase